MRRKRRYFLLIFKSYDIPLKCGFWINNMSSVGVIMTVRISVVLKYEEAFEKPAIDPYRCLVSLYTLLQI